MRYEDVISSLKAQANPANVAGMARFGISSSRTLGVGMPALEKLAKAIKKDHPLALRLWNSGVHEARILASMVDDPKQVTEAQMEGWVGEVDSWDVCDSLCMKLYSRTPFAAEKATAWSQRPEEFVKRAGFVVMASLGLKGRKAPEKQLLAFLPLIRRGAVDERNYVKKAVNWALRQIGKRDAVLNASAARLAQELTLTKSKSARWIGADALRELTSEAVRARLAPSACSRETKDASP
jgi:3-methyladenine DNA glycosylase AlkD